MPGGAKARYYYEKQKLRNIRSVSITGRTEESTEVISTAGDGEPIEWTDPPKRGANVTFETTILEDSGPEVDWMAIWLQRPKTRFTFQRVINFQTFIMRRCVVQNVEETEGDNGEKLWQVSISSLHVELLNN